MPCSNLIKSTKIGELKLQGEMKGLIGHNAGNTFILIADHIQTGAALGLFLQSKDRFASSHPHTLHPLMFLVTSGTWAKTAMWN
jgi:hypothetical protein